MPINLNTVGTKADTAINLRTKKYFDKQLTGMGTSAKGYFNKENHTLADNDQHTADILPHIDELPFGSHPSRSLGNSGFKQVYSIPASVFVAGTYQLPIENAIVDLDDITNTKGRYVDTQDIAGNTYDIYVSYIVKSIQKAIPFATGGSTTDAKNTRFALSYTSFLTFIEKDKRAVDLTAIQISDREDMSVEQQLKHLVSGQALMLELTPDHMAWAYENVPQYLGHTHQNAATILDEQAAVLYQDDRLTSTITNILKTSTAETADWETLLNLVDYFDATEFDTIMDHHLQAWLDLLQQGTTPKAFEQLINGHTRLKLTNEIANITRIKPLVPVLPENELVEKELENNTFYSEDQKAIIRTREPYTVVQAGAGTGKTSTIVGRMAHMKALGVDMDEVLAFSFTNAAADVISERFENAHSYTFASIVNDIIMYNFPSQNLVPEGTLVNALSELDTKSGVFKSLKETPFEIEQKLNTFRIRVKALFEAETKRSANSNPAAKRADLQIYVDKNLDFVLNILNGIGMSSFNLQPIVVSSVISDKSRNFKLSDKLDNVRYIIADEAQDIASYEYILLLRLVEIFKAQLMIVGDGAQTLYEWRDSDPRFLNALEVSSSFHNYKLTINYRSRQIILDYANILLNVIRSNEHAKIQLRANDDTNYKPTDVFDTITYKTYENQPKSHYTKDTDPRTRAEFIDEAINDVFNDVVEFVKDGNKVAFQARTNADTNAILEAVNDAIESRGLDLKVVDLRTKRSDETPIWTNVFTSYAKGVLLKTPFTSNFHEAIKRAMEEGAGRGARSKAQEKYYKSRVNKAVNEYINLGYQIVRNNPATNNKHMVLRHFFHFLTQYETKMIAQEQNLRGQDKPDTSNADIIVSTVHSMKGFEFDGTVTFVNHKQLAGGSAHSCQEMLQLFHVALTRAKTREWIIEDYEGSSEMHDPENIMTDAIQFGYNELVRRAKEAQGTNGKN